MNPWLTAIPIAVVTGCVFYWFFYSVSLFASSDTAFNLGQIEALKRRARLRAALLFVLTLALLGFRFELTKLVAAWRGSSQTTGRDIRVWVNTRSGFYYCPGTEFYGRLRPGKYLSEWSAVQSGYEPALKRPCR